MGSEGGTAPASAAGGVSVAATSPGGALSIRGRRRRQLHLSRGGGVEPSAAGRGASLSSFGAGATAALSVRQLYYLRARDHPFTAPRSATAAVGRLCPDGQIIAIFGCIRGINCLIARSLLYIGAVIARLFGGARVGSKNQTRRG